VHGERVTLHLEDQWIRNITVTTGLVDTYSTPTLMRLDDEDPPALRLRGRAAAGRTTARRKIK
jgi:hypothetical protein